MISPTWSSYAILYPKNYEDKARDKIANLPAYLLKTYGSDVLESLPADTQESLQDITWDKKTGRPLTKLDRELDDTLEVGDALDYVDLSILNQPAERPSPVILYNYFTPKLDTQSVSTFGTLPSPSRWLEAASLEPFLGNDNGTIVSAMTIDSRMSKLENSFENVEEMLKQLVRRTNLSTIGDQVTQPLASQNAGAAHTAPSTGV